MQTIATEDQFSQVSHSSNVGDEILIPCNIDTFDNNVIKAGRYVLEEIKENQKSPVGLSGNNATLCSWRGPLQ